MRLRGWILVGVAVVAALAWWHRDWIDGETEARREQGHAHRYSFQAFEAWLSTSPDDRRTYIALTSYLTKEGVSDVVPPWQLTRTDTAPKPHCKRQAFIVPPPSLWPHIVPTLRLIRAEVIPAVGPVEIRSGYRTRDFNDCVGGASKSQHLQFRGVDLVATHARDNRQLFKTLCALHRRIGPAQHFGLGAYFDPTKPSRNRDARFHVDAAGYRSWGFSKKAASSGCTLMK